MPTAVQRAFRLRFNIQTPTRKSICRWNHQFEQIGCLCKCKSSGRPSVSEENVRRIQESSERSPRKSTRTWTWNTATNCLACVEAPFTVQLSPPFWITLYFKAVVSVMGSHITWMLFALHVPYSKFCKDGLMIVKWQQHVVKIRRSTLFCLTDTRNDFVLKLRSLTQGNQLSVVSSHSVPNL